MVTVHKYTLILSDEQALDLPANSEILSVAEQWDSIVLYARVDTDEKTWLHHSIIIRGTGHPFNGKEGKFIGTVKINGGKFMFHVFEGVQ